MKNLKNNIALFALIIGLFLTFSHTTQAATLTVNNLSDTQLNDSACTLREAIINANADNQTGSTDCTAGAGADTINITTAGTINLLAALPDLTTDMTINGLGAANTTVRRDAAAATEFRIFTKTAGTSTISNLTARDGIARGATGATGGTGEGGGIFNFGGQLTLTNVTVTNNRAIGGNGTGGAGGQAAGGGIYASAPLIVSGSTISNNTATGGTGTTNGGTSFGGGIFGVNALLIVSDSTISSNTATGGTGSTNGSGFGGGINVNNGGSLNMTNSTVSNNSATGDGGITNSNGTSTLTNSIVSGNTATGSTSGGIYNNGTLTLTGSTVSGNTAPGNSGGGIYNFTSGNLTLTSSTVSGNSTGANGGGFRNFGTLTLNNSTVSGNTATGTVSGAGFGGGISNSGTVTLESVTFSNNSALANSGGGISNQGTGTTTLNNTIIANSLRGGDCARPGGTINATYSLIEDGSCGVMNGVNNNLTGDPNLGALANNGGATQTHALQFGSIAIDTGNSSLTTDQRGSPRPVDIPSAPNGTGNIADIGSFEVQSEPSPAPAPYLVNSINDPGNGTCDAAECTLREAINGANAAVGFNQQINFAPSLAGQTITLTAGQLSITDVSGTLTINGLGANQLTVSGNNASRVFSINSGVNATINSISVTGGNGVGSNSSGNGGGILNSGILTLTGLTVNSNSAANFGGGIYNTGTATLTNLVFNANSANNGAGVGNVGTLTITDSTVANNTTVTGSPVTNSGGGLYNFPGGTMTVNGSTVNGNSTTNTGAGIFNGGTLTINNSTVSSNTAAPFGGGGIRVEGGTANATLNSSTISNNPAGPNTGGGISVVGGSIATLNNTIVANSPTGGDCFNNASTINATYSLIEDNLTCVNGMMNTNNLTGDPNLEGLGNNGGSTQTHKLLPGSIAIDAGSNALVPIGFTTDQRGQNRMIDGDGNGSAIVDIGSFEALGTTAASVSISGRVSDGSRGISRAVVHITDQDGNIRTARTNPFGYYRFTDVAVGQTLIVNVFHKQYQFNPQVVSINDHIANLDFTPQNNQINR